MGTSLASGPPDTFSVAAAAARLGVSPRTLRYYEELGFLTPLRTRGGHRQFTSADVEIVERTRRMQALGFSLKTIRRSLRYRTFQDPSGEYRMADDDLRRFIGDARDDAAAMRARIATLRRELDDAVDEAAKLDRDVAALEARLAARRPRGGA